MSEGRIYNFFPNNIFTIPCDECYPINNPLDNKFEDNNNYIQHSFLLSIENNREFNTDEVSRDKELIAYNYDILLNKQYITNYGNKELSKSSSIEDLMCVVEYIEEKSNQV